MTPDETRPLGTATNQSIVKLDLCCCRSDQNIGGTFEAMTVVIRYVPLILYVDLLV